VLPGNDRTTTSREESMTDHTLAASLEREHREIDVGIAEFEAGLGSGEIRSETLSRALATLRRHIYIEETFLFPPLRPGLVAPLFVMVREHGEMWRLMSALEAQVAAGADAAALREVLRHLTERLEAHNFKEERIVYPQADSALSQDTIDDLQRQIATATMPDGWASQGAARG
jgi:iron-sulfur cluster repair protein YtfE (RIC family)